MLKKLFMLILIISMVSFSATEPNPKRLTEAQKAQREKEKMKARSIKESLKNVNKNETKPQPKSQAKAAPAKVKASKEKPKTNIVAVRPVVQNEKIEEDDRPEYTAVLVGDMEGNIIYGENTYEKHPLASTTKVMTMLLAFEALRRGDISLNDDVIISSAASKMEGSKIKLKAGEKFKLKELIEAAAILSANNAAYAVGEHVGKSYDNFIKMMNQKAKKLGIDKDVEFFTPTGLPPGMTKKGMDMGTPKGMYKLMLEANKYPEYLAIAGTKNTKIKNGTILLKNRNNLLGREGIYGLKTGFHNTAGFNILVMSDKDGLKLNYIVFGGRSVRIRDEKVIELDREIRAEIEKKVIVNDKKSLWTVSIKKSKVGKVDLYADKSYERLVKRTDNVEVKMNVDKKITAPLKAGSVVGKYNVYINNEFVHQGNVMVRQNIEARKGLF